MLLEIEIEMRHMKVYLYLNNLCIYELDVEILTDLSVALKYIPYLVGDVTNRPASRNIRF